MACFGFPPDVPDLPRELPRLGSGDWEQLCHEVFTSYCRYPDRYRGARMFVVHPHDSESLAIVAMVERGEFVSDNLECPRVATVLYRGRTFTLLERPQPLRPHWPGFE